MLLLTNINRVAHHAGIRKNWKKRFFKLSVQQLAYYSFDAKQRFKGSIPLELVRITQPSYVYACTGVHRYTHTNTYTYIYTCACVHTQKRLTVDYYFPDYMHSLFLVYNVILMGCYYFIIYLWL